jgi:hypothetical protein
MSTRSLGQHLGVERSLPGGSSHGLRAPPGISGRRPLRRCRRRRREAACPQASRAVVTSSAPLSPTNSTSCSTRGATLTTEGRGGMSATSSTYRPSNMEMPERWALSRRTNRWHRHAADPATPRLSITRLVRKLCQSGAWECVSAGHCALTNSLLSERSQVRLLPGAPNFARFRRSAAVSLATPTRRRSQMRSRHRYG